MFGQFSVFHSAEPNSVQAMAIVALSKNLLLSALSREEYAPLRPHLAEVRLKQKTVLQQAGEPITHVYFPLSGMISMLAVQDRRSYRDRRYRPGGGSRSAIGAEAGNRLCASDRPIARFGTQDRN